MTPFTEFFFVCIEYLNTKSSRTYAWFPEGLVRGVLNVESESFYTASGDPCIVLMKYCISKLIILLPLDSIDDVVLVDDVVAARDVDVAGRRGVQYSCVPLSMNILNSMTRGSH